CRLVLWRIFEVTAHVSIAYKSIKKHGRHWRGGRSPLRKQWSGQGPAEPRKRHTQGISGRKKHICSKTKAPQKNPVDFLR
ncbi:MAG: hypothetical protein J5817_00770, partial [Treponema sp.]|nr:hypothetical protein [Treponema sp.]